MATNELANASLKLTSLVLDKDELKKNQERKPAAKKNTGKNRRKSRELVLKAVYRGMLNESDMSSVYRDMAEDPDYNKADETYFKHLLESVTSHAAELDEKMASFIHRKVTELRPVEHSI